MSHLSKLRDRQAGQAAGGRRWAWATALALGLSLASAPFAQAGQTRALSLTELVGRSDATVLGHPIGQTAYWDHGRIVTRVEVRADEVWDGDVQPGQTVQIYTLGGEVGDIAQRVDGAAALPVYGRMVLHLRRLASGYTPTAMAQGLWLVDGLYGESAQVRSQGAHALQQQRRPGTALARFDDLRALRAAVKEAARAKHD